MRRDSGSGRSEAVEAEAVSAPAAGSAVAVAVVAAETEAVQALTAAFGPVDRWWIGLVRGLGVMRLPLP